jgi:hypothetical protein
VELPAPLLESGVTLVDTPGLGSLATSGAAETLAYLPHCDVAAVLVDAASTITDGDLATIRALLDAGVRVSVLVSKADLLTQADLDTEVDYVRHTLGREFDTSIGVTPVSIKPDFDEIYEQWHQVELSPLIADQQRQRREAAARKIEILRAQLVVTLRRWVETPQPGEVALKPHTRDDADLTLQNAGGKITALERQIDDLPIRLLRRFAEAIEHAAKLIDAGEHPQKSLEQAFSQVAGDVAREVGRRLEDLSRELRSTAESVSGSVQWIATLGESDSERRFGETPVPALPPDIRVPAEGAERIFGHALARSFVTRRLEHAVGGALKSTMEDYGAVLRRWALNHLNDIRAEWAATTDALRAEIDRQHGHASTARVSVEEVQRDLQQLMLAGVR